MTLQELLDWLRNLLRAVEGCGAKRQPVPSQKEQA